MHIAQLKETQQRRRIKAGGNCRWSKGALIRENEYEKKTEKKRVQEEERGQK
jgi:hypothetical protein